VALLSSDVFRGPPHTQLWVQNLQAAVDEFITWNKELPMDKNCRVTHRPCMSRKVPKYGSIES